MRIKHALNTLYNHPFIVIFNLSFVSWPHLELANIPTALEYRFLGSRHGRNPDSQFSIFFTLCSYQNSYHLIEVIAE